MDKRTLKNFALSARKQLVEEIGQKAEALFEISEGELTAEEIKKRRFLIEETAFSWFIRFIILWYMEVNDYYPAGLKILSLKDPNFFQMPSVINTPANQERLSHYIQCGDQEGLFRSLLILQWDLLQSVFPELLETIDERDERLLPSNLHSRGSVIRKLVESIDEANFREHVEVIGWLYQYYVSEKKDEVFEGLKKNIKISKDNIPAATQLFTPEWIVRYLVENSIGRLWIEAHPDEALQAKWDYYLVDEEQEAGVSVELKKIRETVGGIQPESIKVLDPSVGTGHMLVYTFDLLYDIYQAAGYSERDIPVLILEKNLFGLDIDDRSAKLAAFALWMKARSKNPRVFEDKIELNICSIQESNHFPRSAIDAFFISNQEDLTKILDLFQDAKEYGSILEIPPVHLGAIEARLKKIRENVMSHYILEQNRYEIRKSDCKCLEQNPKDTGTALRQLTLLIKQAKIMAQKYDVVVTNPPYMGRKGMGKKLVQYVDRHYPESSSDLFAVFMEKGFRWCKPHGFNAMVTMQSWMYLRSFEKFREAILSQRTIWTLLHMGNMVMGIAFGTSATVFRNSSVPMFKGRYLYMEAEGMEKEQPKVFPPPHNRNKAIAQQVFEKLPNRSIAYWLNEKNIALFQEAPPLGAFGKCCKGIDTGDNARFLRLWHEVKAGTIRFPTENVEEARQGEYKWVPYNKGGSFRKWYGNNEFVLNWQDEGEEIRSFPKSNLRNKEFYYVPGITWSTVTSGSFSARSFGHGYLFDNGGSCFFCEKDKRNYILGLLNSKLIFLIDSLNPTINYQPGDIARLPVVEPDEHTLSQVNALVRQNIELSRRDWDNQEISWDFERHPLLMHKQEGDSFEETFHRWEGFAEGQFKRLRANEEKLNRVFIDLYGLKGDLAPNVLDKDISIKKADALRDVNSFLSYAVGCMFGRYSLVQAGLIYGGGDFGERWRQNNADQSWEVKVKGVGWVKTAFGPVEGNIVLIANSEALPSCDENIADCLAKENDIVHRFEQFMGECFGTVRLEENLNYVARILGKKSVETALQTIRRYFHSDFFKDHLQVYRKRPIYWQVNSGPWEGFKALIYMHRYDPETLTRLRTIYLPLQIGIYEAELRRLEGSGISNPEKGAIRKKEEKIWEQLKECHRFSETLARLAEQALSLDIDDGVQVNYAKLQSVLARI
ncbi:BREX-1 system adenine-specific DNA-methyltransferase PglX [Heliobacterium chlorum]|uniref:site-specific DNA-methyltransferase (adenine-specific) n=1 Tax=Heliobacterium chlorum TaxID=2698 RepID=A0ABR7SZ37_HELCL|nr:BREX-1 system adenine-specific DNA-methyltransferase PglX [Heliobacterium chlorum]MBC9783691.1 BREX-1 system adenine-specific DNA-methyltransferase PglX [Heliobacterium chlorum]